MVSASEEQGHISQTTSPHPLHFTGQDWRSHANLDKTGKENLSYWFRLSWLALRRGWGLLFPESQGRYFYQIPGLRVKKGGLNVKFAASVSERRTAFFLKVMVVGSGEEQCIQSKDTAKVMVRSNLSFIHPLPFTTLACIHGPFLPFSLPRSLPPSYLPSFLLSTFLLLNTNLPRFIICSVLFLVPESQSWARHTVPSCIFYDHESLSPFSLPHAPSSCMKPFMNTAARSDLSLLSRVFTIPEAACQFSRNLVWEKWEDVPWEILDIKSILELDSVCLFPSPPT